MKERAALLTVETEAKLAALSLIKCGEKKKSSG